MARMLGSACRSWCPKCRAPAGEDCPDSAVPSVKTARARERRAWRRELERST